MEPVAIEMLHNFREYADKIDTFRELESDAEKYVFWHSEYLWPPRDMMGITDGWVNAMSYLALANGVKVTMYSWDKASGKIKRKGQTVDNPTLTWNTHDGNPPDYFQDLRAIQPGKVVLAQYLVNASNTSAYLRALGLTPAAIGDAYVKDE